jgi:CRISPR associated protein
MQLEYKLNKPAAIRGYPLHRLVMGLTDGQPALFADAGEDVLIRTGVELDAPGTEIMQFGEGDMTAFELRACCGKKRKGKNIYFALKDWRSRHDWLKRKGEQLGFQPLTVHCTSEIATIDNSSGRSFRIDQTDFVGVLKVTDAELFQKALTGGVGSVAKTYGFGMLIVN